MKSASPNPQVGLIPTPAQGRRLRPYRAARTIRPQDSSIGVEGMEQLTFEDFHRQRVADALRYATAILGQNESEDACQEAWLRIWRAWGTADPARLDAWAFRIVRNCCIDRQRVQHYMVPIEEITLPPSPPPDEVVVGRVDARASLSLLARLSPSLREALWLREVMQLSYAEIAHLQEVAIGTVMSRLHAARRKVERLLGKEDR